MDEPHPKEVAVLPGNILPALPADEVAQTQLVLMDKTDAKAVAAEEGAGGGKPVVEAEKKEVVPSVSYWQLFSQADRLDWTLVIIGSVAAAANGVAWPVFAILFASFTNSFGGATTDPDFSSAFTDIALQFVYLAIACFVASYLQAAAWMWTGNRQTSRLRLLYLAAVLRQDVAYFDTQGTAGSLLQGLNDDSAAVQAAMSEKAGHFIQHMTTFIAGIIVAFWRGWDMTLVMIGCMPFLAGIGVVFSKMSTYISTKSTEAYSKASSIAQQSISQVRTVAAYNREQKSVDDYTQALDLPLQVGLRQAVVTGLSLGGINSIIYFTYALAFYYGAWRVSVGAYDGGDVLNVLVAALLGGFSLGQAAPVLQVFSRGQAAGGSIFAVVNRVPEIPTDDPEGRKLEHVEGRLELRNIAFTYPARLDAPIFTDFSLSIPSGKTVALVGSSGSGKSTIVQLIERFYDPSQGSVLLDDVDLRQLNLTWLRQQIGMVSQEPTLFATDIFENIKMGKSDATFEEVEEAARSANAYNFITSLPKGFHTQVGERGLQLSGGQKQRIAIARAILKNPKVLLLDEATSALDTESERIVQDALNRIIVGRTTVVVAHRLSTVQDADVIAVLRLGTLVEMGSHKELIAKPEGAYATLVHLQMQEEQRKEEEAPADEDEAALSKGMGVLDSVEEGDPKLQLSGDHAGRKQSGGLAKGLVAGLLPRRSAEVGRLSAKGSNELSEVLVVDGAADTPGQTNGQRFSIDAQKVSGKHLETAPSGFKEVAEPAKKEKPADVPLSRLVNINRPEWGYGFLGAVASAINGVTQPAFAFVISGIIIVLYDTDLSAILGKASFWSWMFFVIGVAVLAATIIQQWSFGVMGQHLACRVRIMLFSSILRQEIGFFDMEENGSGILTSRLATDATYVRGMVGDTVGLMLQNLTCLAAGYAIAFAYDWRMALVVTGALPFLVVGMVLYYKFTMGFDSGSNELYALANQSVSEAFSSIRVVQAYNLQGYVVALYTKLLAGTESVMAKRANLTGMLMGYSNFSIFAVYGLVVWFGGLEVSSGRASFEDMLKAFLAILLAAMGIAQAQIGFPDIGKAKAAVQSIFPLIDRQSKIDPCDPVGDSPKEMEGAIELRDVRFIYPARPTVVVFRKFSIKIPAGQTVALVGESGSGKSTIVGLIERFYDPQEGVVSLDGVDLRQLNVAWLRQRVGLVSQEPLLFSSSILENIRYGRPDATLEEIMEAARSANAYDFITALPDGFDTHVGEKGMQLSGGQKQRVAIARAMVKQPKVLLLDEATSALDSQSEQVVQAALDKIMVGRTSIVVAHRLSTVRNAHAIALVYRGSILEQGSHDELMAIPDGGYAKLVAAQGGNRGSTNNLQAMASRGRPSARTAPGPARLDGGEGSVSVSPSRKA